MIKHLTMNKILCEQKESVYLYRLKVKKKRLYRINVLSILNLNEHFIRIHL